VRSSEFTLNLESLSKRSALVLTALLFLFLGFPNSNLASPPSAFVYPLVGTRVSSDFGTRKHPVLRIVKHHDGIDLAAPDGSPVRAIASGSVIFEGPYKGYGNLVVIRHAGGMTSHYGHCSAFTVKPGQQIKAGQIIAKVGHTGMVTGPHLHFEVRIDGKAQNPERYIQGLDDPAKG